MDDHKRFAGTDKDSLCASVVEDDMIRLFAKLVQNPRSDITVEDGTIRQQVHIICAFNVNKEVRKRASTRRSEIFFKFFKTKEFPYVFYGFLFLPFYFIFLPVTEQI